MLLRFIKMFLGGLTVLSTISVSAIYFLQNKVVYPSWAQGARNHVDTPDKFDMPYKRVELTTRDDIVIEGYDIQNDDPDSISTVLILCPNAGNIGFFLPIVDIFYRQLNLSVFIYSYRGYGFSEGSPSEDGLKIDADRVMSYLATSSFHKNKKLILYGRSLGGANAIYIASKFSQLCDAVILENTFLSIPKVIPYMYPPLKYFAYFCHEIWESESEIINCSSSAPFLFLSGLQDEIVPPMHMKKLYQLCPSSQKQVIEFPSGHHNDTIIQDGYWEVIRTFLEQYKLIN
ncbi:hypothetical protein Kpol_1038p19 [Vanderwaltozyma polyspora DSM 70294]|uniref:AB hydrolase-1 domain-containing protein n=1 Tax=Vanderwaltozyma polyspora (strain ATCC 22028 / DSM 70294 / BCRC 21397 / CBS 2163 / NBRC 10782 / NRRL Y-8283 / UCD 57-17) TaxID=436907 RepID=A7TR09_VANPO|nr:uncharacterized protein Kpol_1038p19 [Vanderwaltozyma polyspora DSM 70294]EDO15312.1 hypothetical protein Kpol_1038p19 [Vanderwaltozyma polyspora DSM 70294]